MNDDFDALKASWSALGSDTATAEAQVLSRRAIRRARIRELAEAAVTLAILAYVAERTIGDPRPGAILLAIGIAGLLLWSSVVRFRESRQRWSDTATERMAFLEREVLFTRIDLQRALLSIALTVPLFAMAFLFGRQRDVTIGAAEAFVAPLINLLGHPAGKPAAVILLVLLLGHLIRSALVSRRALAHFSVLAAEYRREAERDRIDEASGRWLP